MLHAAHAEEDGDVSPLPRHHSSPSRRRCILAQTGNSPALTCNPLSYCNASLSLHVNNKMFFLVFILLVKTPVTSLGATHTHPGRYTLVRLLQPGGDTASAVMHEFALNCGSLCPKNLHYDPCMVLRDRMRWGPRRCDLGEGGFLFTLLAEVCTWWRRSTSSVCPQYRHAALGDISLSLWQYVIQ